jgi:hypothetical protein
VVAVLNAARAQNATDLSAFEADLSSKDSTDGEDGNDALWALMSM